MSEKRKVKSEKLFITCLFLLITCYFVACSENKSYKREFVIADSKSYESSLFRQNCAICHGQEANGKELADGRLVPSLRYGEAAKKTEAEIYDQIKNGKLPMPSFKNQLTEEEIQKMVKFVIRDLQGRE
ncbi:MAG: cytochrome c [Pyrinomonadaceae bacterium]|nr:cytochrome c [Pyrinomonadaceae bacterium]